MSVLEQVADDRTLDPATGAGGAGSIVPPDVLAAASADQPSTDRPAVATVENPTVRPIDYDAEARDLIEFTYAMVSPLYPTLATVYTPEVRSRIAAAGAPLMRKYNIDLGALGPELGFAIVVLPLVAPTIQAISHDRQQQKQQAPAAPAASSSSAAIAANDDAAGKSDESPLERFPGQASS